MNSKENEYLLGIDLGTTQCKAILFDTKGNVLSLASEEYPTIRTEPGWALHRPENWWDAVKHTVKTVTKGVDSSRILGIGADGTQEGVVPVDAQGNKLADCMTWEDLQSVPQQDWIRSHIGDDTLMEITGTTSNFPGAAPRVLHIKEHTPETYKKTYKFLSIKDYVNYRLTNCFATDWSNAGHTQLLDLRSRRWSEDIFNKMGLTTEKWPEVHASTDIIGEVTASAAEETGLMKGTKVIAGGGDQEASAVGSGAARSGIVYEVVGTTDMVCVTLAQPVFNRNFECFCHPEQDKWILAWGSPAIMGEILRWFRDNLGHSEIEAARREKKTPYEIMDNEAEQANDTDIIFLPRGLNGSSIFNINFSHTKKEIIRAIYEGSAYWLRFFLELLQSLGIDTTEVVLSGGVSRSKIWRQIRADVTRKTFLLPRVSDTATFGSALLAGVGIGCYKSIKDAAAFVAYDATISPDQEASVRYDGLYGTYKELRSKLGI